MNRKTAKFRYSSPAIISLVAGAALIALALEIRDAPVTPQNAAQGPVLAAAPGDKLNLSYSYSFQAPAR